MDAYLESYRPSKALNGIVFTTPRPMVHDFASIQINALRNWRAVFPDWPILVIGPHSDNLCREAQIDNVYTFPDIACGSYGTPLLSDVWRIAEATRVGDYFLYANADILFGANTLMAFTWVSQRFMWFVLSGQRYDIQIDFNLDFGNGDCSTHRWDNQLKGLVSQHARLHPPGGMDYFLFRRGTWPRMPSFSVARNVYDNWLIYDALRRRIPVIDATKCILAVHQNHSYADSGGVKKAKGSPGYHENIRLAGGLDHCRSLDSATYYMLPNGEIKER